jgi:hypothetical protein
MADSYSVSRDLKSSSSTCLTYPERTHNSHIMWVGIFAHKFFRVQPVGVLTHVAQDTNLNSSTSSCGRLPSREGHHFHLDFKDTNHWAAKGPSRRYDVRSSQGTTSRSFYFCEDYGVGLCLSVLQTGSHKTPRMNVYHAEKVNWNNEALWNPNLTSCIPEVRVVKKTETYVQVPIQLKSLPYVTVRREKVWLATNQITWVLLRKTHSHVAIHVCRGARHTCLTAQISAGCITYIRLCSKSVKRAESNKFIQLTNTMITLQLAC